MQHNTSNTAPPSPELSGLPENQNKNLRHTRLQFFIGAAVILAAVFIGLSTRNQDQTTGVVVRTVYPITPKPRYMANGVTAGNPNGKGRIDVFEDFQCPACRQYSMEIDPKLMCNDVSNSRIYYVFHSFFIIDRATWDSPVKKSDQAANAAICAADQNRF